MGLFDKVRTLVGDHGCKVAITSLERQAPGAVRFPIGDSVFKGNFTVTASRACTVLGHKAELFVMKKHADGREEQVLLGDELHDEKHEVIGLGYTWPYDMAAGETREDGFCIVQVDIPGTVEKLGYASPSAAASATDLTFFVRVTADVKGTPMDAEAKEGFTVVA